ncbi:class I tRNA ligase family protein, partial [Nocardioides sp.]|uniref:class I tRNA ligase family protein n=1 Tax=Nocardioides sp. TaxID=35761 RepID=UPI0025CD642A
MTYPKVGDGAVPSSPKFPEIEERILEFWKQDGTFQASIDQRDPGENGANEFVFYDGPPFANGLPAELEAMRLNGIKTTDEILELGIEKFNEACRASVMKYTGEWREYVTRQARWVDFDNDYKTMNPDYMES